MTLHQSMLDSLNCTGDSHSDMDQSRALLCVSSKYICLVHVTVHMYGLQIIIWGDSYGATSIRDSPHAHECGCHIVFCNNP